MGANGSQWGPTGANGANGGKWEPTGAKSTARQFLEHFYDKTNVKLTFFYFSVPKPSVKLTFLFQNCRNF